MNMSADSPSAGDGTIEITERVRRLEGQVAALTVLFLDEPTIRSRPANPRFDTGGPAAASP